MTAPTLTLADFLLARIAEDEENPPRVDRWAGYVDGLSDADWAKINAEQAAWDRRWAAECEAKRRIVEAYEKNRGRIEANASDHTRASASGDLSALPTLRSAGWDLGGRDWALEVTLRLLALPYADHPGYREDWRP